MSDDILMRIIELFAGLILEGIILGFIFMWISNNSQQKQEQKLQEEMNNIEKQNKFDFEQLQNEIRQSKTEIISQLKEGAGTD